ncbi:MAG TPA: thiamine phosphate synthase [Smithellaceae bacterium]|nr:thiamine phosphate synthase [Smithellaceae bacterium]
MQGVYLVTDRGLCRDRSLEDVVLQAVQGGAAYVQLREKDLSTREFVEEALAIKERLLPYRVPLIINDRIDVALACQADGVHVGQGDMPYATARKLMGPKAIVGLSVETWQDVLDSQPLDVDYIGISPVFATPTKTDTKEPWGLDGIRKIKAYSRHPLVAIGGINESNARAVVEAGAACLAVVSAVCSADDPAKAAARLKNIIEAVSPA